MTYLELVQQLRGECAIQGDGPATVLSQVGMLAKLVRWIREAHIEIQAKPFEWKFLRSTVSLPVTAGTFDYPLGGAPWNRPDIRYFEPAHAILLRADGSYQRVQPTEFDDFQSAYPVISPTPATPTRLTILPNNVVRFNTTPDAAYSLQSTVRLMPQILAADGDVPNLPSEFHSILVHRAKMKYSEHDGAGDLFQGASADYKAQLRDLITATVPSVRMHPVPLFR